MCPLFAVESQPYLQHDLRFTSPFFLLLSNHVITWVGGDAFARNQSLLHVRKLHKLANRTVVANYGKDAAMSQFDMVVTQWAFVGPFFIFPERVGIPKSTRRDREAIAHYMFMVGHILGVKDGKNTSISIIVSGICYNMYHLYRVQLVCRNP